MIPRRDLNFKIAKSREWMTILNDFWRSWAPMANLAILTLGRLRSKIKSTQEVTYAL